MPRALIALVLVAPVLAADPEKPVTPKDDELAVLADFKSPDRQTVIDRYEGKVLKLSGYVAHHQPGPVGNADPGVASISYYSIRIPASNGKDKPAILREISWAADEATKKAIKQVDEKANKDSGRFGQPSPKVAHPGLMLTIYAKLEGGKLTGAATELKNVGAKAKEKEPARLKDK